MNQKMRYKKILLSVIIILDEPRYQDIFLFKGHSYIPIMSYTIGANFFFQFLINIFH